MSTLSPLIDCGESPLKRAAFVAADSHLEGNGDLVSRLIMGINRVTMWVVGHIHLLTKSP